METTDVLLVVLLIAASALCGVAIWALREMIETARSMRVLSDDMRSNLVPLIEKADVTVDAVNAELLRIDAIITQVEEASARVSHASGTISDIVSTPAEIVNDVAGRVRRAWKDRRRGADAPDPESEDQVPPGAHADFPEAGEGDQVAEPDPDSDSSDEGYWTSSSGDDSGSSQGAVS